MMVLCDEHDTAYRSRCRYNSDGSEILSQGLVAKIVLLVPKLTPRRHQAIHVRHTHQKLGIFFLLALGDGGSSCAFAAGSPCLALHVRD
jgi:hypothetical protein